MKDLFGNEVTETEARALLKKAKKGGRGSTQPRGYARPPGSGPKGETCKSCRYMHRKKCSKTYLKCLLMYAHWTGGGGTDIRAKAPACEKWKEIPKELLVVRKQIETLRKDLPKDYCARSSRDGWIYAPSIGGSPYPPEIQAKFRQGEELRKMEHKLELAAGMLLPAPPKPITGAR